MINSSQLDFEITQFLKLSLIDSKLKLLGLRQNHLRISNQTIL